MLNPVHLQTLVSVLRTGSFADAGRELGYTGSAVSQQIAGLEKQVRAPLFDRSARSITPTPAAELLADRSREVLALLREMEEDISAMAVGQLGALRLGSFPTASEALLPPAFRRFMSTHPDVTVRLGEAESDDLIDRLRDGQIDLTLIYQYDLVPRALPPGLSRVPLLQEDLLLIVPESHRLESNSNVRWADLKDEIWITTREGTAGAECLQRLCAQAGFEPQIAFRSNDYNVIREFVHSGLGVALVPALCHGQDPGLRVVQNATPGVHRWVSVLHARSNPIVTGFLAALHGAARDIASPHMRPPEGTAREAEH